MEVENTLMSLHAFHRDLKIVKEKIYDKCDFEFTNPKPHTESIEYGACSFELNGKVVQHRVSKITPTKTGQFVTIWKRTKDGITAPFDFSDTLDFIIITSRSEAHLGQFVFPKKVLVHKGIISKNGKGGKRGIRVYPPWDLTTSKQAEKTQSWQLNYFMSIIEDHSTDLSMAKKLFGKNGRI